MEKRLMPEVLGRFFAAGMDIVACKMAKLKEQTLESHYAHIVGKPYYPPLVEFMQRRPVVIAVLVKKVRELLGPTNSQEAPKGTIRGDFGENTRENIAHASDSIESAAAEIARFFSEDEVF